MSWSDLEAKGHRGCRLDPHLKQHMGEVGAPLEARRWEKTTDTQSPLGAQTYSCAWPGRGLLQEVGGGILRCPSSGVGSLQRGAASVEREEATGAAGGGGWLVPQQD